ncbi:MAG TPA: phosphate butyryltransferase, partial [Firmicutes bacterium]|nr:phosphate butyryltransferase [Bacillota bacterium]
MLTSLDAILAAAKATGGRKKIAVAVAQDPEVITAIKGAYELGIATAILVGDAE